MNKSVGTVVDNSAQGEPTLAHIVDIPSELTLGECTQVIMIKTHGSKDLSDQRILR